MRRFWDERAREDAAFFLDDRLTYGCADLDRLWEQGEIALATFGELLSVEIQADDRVLEIGCSIGRMTRAIAARAESVIGLDLSPEMLARAKRLNPGLENVRWIEGDGVSLAGVDDGEVTACVSHLVFQHIPDPAVMLGYVHEMGRVLAPHGWSAFGVSNDPIAHLPRDVSTIARVRRLIGEAARRIPGGRASPYWLGSAVDLDQLAGAARDGGLEVERVVGEGTQFCLVALRKR